MPERKCTQNVFFCVSVCKDVASTFCNYVSGLAGWPAGWSEWEHSESENAFNNNLPDFIYHPVRVIDWKLIWFVHSAILKSIKLFLEGVIFRLFHSREYFRTKMRLKRIAHKIYRHIEANVNIHFGILTLKKSQISVWWPSPKTMWIFHESLVLSI